ncbi:hypothetical protein PINS_up004595 [Pythium insidiosum]|nr:hypothetical protein PINS_up004595 [Pythium insidiosum]
MNMLDGFVPPHAQFSVFHGSNARAVASTDHWALRFFSPSTARDGVPSDRHLREFVQLDGQLKALLQQLHSQSAALAPRVSRLVDVAQSAAIVECLGFFSRLLTPESFTWPDFLTTMFAKLAELYTHTYVPSSPARDSVVIQLTIVVILTSESDAVRAAVLQIFLQGQAHAAQVNDAAKVRHDFSLLLSLAPHA